MQKYLRAGGWAKNCHRLLLWRKRMREGTDSLSLRRRWGNEEEKRKIREVGQKREPKLRAEQVNLSEVVKLKGSGKAKV